MKTTIFLFLAILSSGYAHPPDHPGPEPSHPPDHLGPEQHHSDCHDQRCVEVLNEALHDIGIYLTDDKCHIFHGLNCADHVLQNDEQICGTDGKTYDTHCLFVKARCEKVLDPANYIDGMLYNYLWFKHHGSCDVSTRPPLTTSVSTVMAAITTGISAVPVNGAGSVTTSFTTASSQTTLDSGHVIVGGVFCQYKNSLNCISNVNMVCATNGKFYTNMCELLKVQCDNPTVTTASDFSYCSLSP